LARGLLRGADRRSGPGYNDIEVQCDKLRRQAQELLAICGEAPFDYDILPLDIAKVAQGLHESSGEKRALARLLAEKADAMGFRSRLGLRHAGPLDGSGDKGQYLPPSHSIVSSA